MRDKRCGSLFLTWILVAVAVVVVGVVAQEEQEQPSPVNEEQQEQSIPVNEEQLKEVRTTGIVKSTVEKKDNNNNPISADGTVENKNNNDAVVLAASTQALYPFQSMQPGRFFASVTSTTETVFVMVTSTVFFSCISIAPSGPACMGRRRKRSLSRTIEVDHDKQRGLSLDSSQQDALLNTGDPGQQRDNIDDTDNNTRLLGINIWSSVRSTSTVTMLFTDTNTTIRLGYYCLAGNVRLPTFNCM
ncbi:hypothetical protein Pcinc_036233 [Petrolisthes cinctipes]|uniref:Uncharacterized protein n=1 Tax=Petrolisthes cinctipes TaxID=88211 RepID=A0AAE1BWI9_PETCI|nr:hypothetical protein Pcinc_036233 [Petrolisthes cinctipes]